MISSKGPDAQLIVRRSGGCFKVLAEGSKLDMIKLLRQLVMLLNEIPTDEAYSIEVTKLVGDPDLN